MPISSIDFPKLPDWKSDIEPLNTDLKGMVDLEKVVVVTGFSEVGPWGNSTHPMGDGSIRRVLARRLHRDGMDDGSHQEPQWSAKRSRAILDGSMPSPASPSTTRMSKPKYEKHILEHSGIRLIEPELFNGYDPNNKQLLQEIQIERRS